MIIQKKTTKLQAWCLGENSPMERQLMAQGLLARQGDTFLVYSRETRQEPQVAQKGDYFKLDGSGCPYPNDRAFFLRQHTRLEEDWYLQKNPPIAAWTVEESMPAEIRWLLDTGRLTIDPENPEGYFSAILWGARLYGARDALVVLRQVRRGGSGEILDIEFYFLAREEFLGTYTICPEGENPWTP